MTHNSDSLNELKIQRIIALLKEAVKYRETVLISLRAENARLCKLGLAMELRVSRRVYNCNNVDLSEFLYLQELYQEACDMVERIAKCDLSLGS